LTAASGVATGVATAMKANNVRADERVQLLTNAPGVATGVATNMKANNVSSIVDGCIGSCDGSCDGDEGE
jgi:hypothetical protein